MKSNEKGLRRLFFASKYSLKGLCISFKTESAFRQELFLLVILLPLVFYFEISSVERALLILVLLILLIVELLNTAVEVVVDRIGADYHELSGRAKDIASAAVFVSLINALLVWMVILW
ncbi:diacylglycerol kinase [Nitrincola sp.]|uniref:diacylglycerol kinase n=1 Tax=Nitrincola sp. TaxID=1926584 RepID=UPI003A8F53C1